MLSKGKGLYLKSNSKYFLKPRYVFWASGSVFSRFAIYSSGSQNCIARILRQLEIVRVKLFLFIVSKVVRPMMSEKRRISTLERPSHAAISIRLWLYSHASSEEIPYRSVVWRVSVRPSISRNCVSIRTIESEPIGCNRHSGTRLVDSLHLVTHGLQVP